MRHNPSDADLFTIEEIAQAAGVSTDQVWNAIRMGQAVPYGRLVTTADAAHLLRVLKGLEPASEKKRAPLTVTPDSHRRAGRGLAAAGFLHFLGVAVMLLLASLGLLSANDTEQELKDPTPVRLVYLMTPGPGGGGGGGGLKNPLPPPPAARKAVLKVVRKPSSPVPRVRPRPAPPAPPVPPPPRPEPPKIEPLIVETPKPPEPKPPEPQAVKAPVVPVPTDLYDAIGKLEQRQSGPPSPPSQGPGTGGGVGSGSGVGVGEGSGGGIGPGTGGGTGGGPYQPGAGIDPPTVVREVRPTYTDEARRQAIEGDVLLEIVVRRDGSVGNVRVRRTLGAGLEQRAIDAVRQWRFSPAKKGGVPVDVVVDVAVEFKLRVP